MSSTSNFDEFQKARAKLTWPIRTRPDICSHTNQLGQVTGRFSNLSHTKKLNEVIAYLKATK